MEKIKFSKNNINKKDIREVEKILKSGWLTHGKYTTLFENEFRKFTNSKYAVTVSSCTAGLHLSCIVAGFGKNDEVIVPAQTHTATAHAVEYTGARAVFADVEINTWTIQPSSIKKLITKKTKAIIPVHMYGHPANMTEIIKIAKKNKLFVIEDAAP